MHAKGTESRAEAAADVQIPLDISMGACENKMKTSPFCANKSKKNIFSKKIPKPFDIAVSI